MDIIQLLPDNLANQIAAGEVIQRPANAVKELLENAIDAGADDIHLIVQDAGKALIQVVDNGKGMSETDARMCFERHATSKIKNIEDLFQVRTMGFRGEALASIAAVAQVELKTKRKDEELGTLLEIENSKIVKQEPCAFQNGTSLSMKNLFFNVPARRNFLKSNSAELRHIIEEFTRVAMAFPALAFSLTNNGQEMFHLDKGSLKQRVVQLLGNNYNSRLVTVEDETDYLNIHGFIGKPEFAKKTRGDQYFFVNNRFIKSAYLNHAVTSAFEQLLPADSFPTYVLFIELDPREVDINVHPTKQEIKFEDERIVYAFVQAAIKHALAQFSIAPTLDFTLNPEIQKLEAISQPFTEAKKSEVETNSPLFQTFTRQNQAHIIDSGRTSRAETSAWKDFYSPNNKNMEDQSTSSSFPDFPQMPTSSSPNTLENEDDPFTSLFQNNVTETAEIEWQMQMPTLQIDKTYILAAVKKGFILIHQQLAHERVLYDKFSQYTSSRQTSQTLLFPTELSLTPADSFLLDDMEEDLKALGYLITKKSDNNYIITGIPADAMEGSETHVIELLLEQYKHYIAEMQFNKREKIIRCLARQQAIKAGRELSQEEMHGLIEQLMHCEMANYTPGGTPTFVLIQNKQIDVLFQKK